MGGGVGFEFSACCIAPTFLHVSFAFMVFLLCLTYFRFSFLFSAYSLCFFPLPYTRYQVPGTRYLLYCMIPGICYVFVVFLFVSFLGFCFCFRLFRLFLIFFEISYQVCFSLKFRTRYVFL